MAYNRTQLESSIRRLLATAPRASIASEDAVDQMLGVAAQESGFGHYLYQLRGPAKGLMQVEPATARWLEDALAPDLVAWLKSWRDDETIEHALEYRLDYNIACARLRFWVVPEPLPAAGDLPAQAAYWKRYYNTYVGKGTEAEYMAAYRNFVSKR